MEISYVNQKKITFNDSLCGKAQSLKSTSPSRIESENRQYPTSLSHSLPQPTPRGSNPGEIVTVSGLKFETVSHPLPSRLCGLRRPWYYWQAQASYVISYVNNIKMIKIMRFSYVNLPGRKRES